MAFSIKTEHAALGRIAETLGIPVEELFTSESAEHLSGAVECLRLWQEITSAAGMKRALNGLGRIAQEERAQSRAEERTVAAD